MALLKKRFLASSLIEVIVSMVLVSMCFILATMIFVQVMKSREKHKFVEALIRANAILKEHDCSMSSVDEDFEFENMVLRKEITTMNGDTKNKVVLVKALTKEGDEILEVKEICGTR